MPCFSMEKVEVFGHGLKSPEEVSFDRQGNAYGRGDVDWIRRITPDRKVTEFADPKGRPLGMAFDTAGKLIVTIVFGAGNQIIASDKKTRAIDVLLHDPPKTKMHLSTNCAFSGSGLTELYIVHLKLDHLCKVAYGAKGHPLYHQR